MNIANNVSNTPLTFTTMYGHVECIRELVSSGANVNTKDKYKQTPLMLTATRRCVIRFGKSQKKILESPN